MPSSAHGTSRLAYPGTLAMLGLALAFPIGLMVFNPTLMFERGWEQYVGTAIYLWAVLTLGRELARLWRNERSFEEAPTLLKSMSAQPVAGQSPLTAKIAVDERRILPARIRQLAFYLEETRSSSVTQLMELNREGSSLDQEQAAGRFTLTRYILYLLPVIGFIGTVEGISKALMNISRVLPMVKDLDGFMSNLTSVTSALQIAFDTTLLALFLSAALMLAQTLVYRRSEDLLARVDRWIVANLLPRLAGSEGASDMHAIGAHVDRFAASVDRLMSVLGGYQRGAEAIARIGHDLEAIGTASESLRKGVASLARIEAVLSRDNTSTKQLEEIKHGIERTGAAIETLSGSWTSAYERSSRSTQEQLARTLNSLKDAIEMLNVSMEQSSALYRNIVRKMFDDRKPEQGQDQIRVA